MNLPCRLFVFTDGLLEDLKLKEAKMAKIRTLKINGKEIEVSEEVYKAYVQAIWKEEKRTQRAYKNLEEQQNKNSS